MTKAAPRAKKRLDELRAEFPAIGIGTGETLYRSHQGSLGAIYYCTCGNCRFDPPPSLRASYGSCCAARDPEIAVLEHLAGLTIVPEDWVARQAISSISPRRHHKIADLQSSTNYGKWGVDGDLQAGGDRGLTQGWGAAFYKSEFHGVQHASRRDPSLSHRCIAFYGAPGAHGEELSCDSTEPLSDGLLNTLAFKFGIQVFPKAPLA